MIYITVDTANLFFRTKMVRSQHTSDWDRVGYAIHLTLNSITSVIKKFTKEDSFHVVACLEGRSWRRGFYEPYKANRDLKRMAMTEEEKEMDVLFNEAFNELIEFLKERTNVSVIKCDTAEGDDVIARFVQLHPDDKHVIVSTDGDFVQLVAPNVSLYNGMAGTMITNDGAFNEKGERLSFTVESNSKIKMGSPDPDFSPRPDWKEYALFLKCIRGDSGDNVFSAYPGVKVKSTKKTIGLNEAFVDKVDKGFNWTNVMMQTWTDHNGVEHRVIDDFNRNRVLIDLTMQPDNVKQTVDECIKQQVNTVPKQNIGIYFMKFCKKYELNEINKYPDPVNNWLMRPYTGGVHES